VDGRVSLCGSFYCKECVCRVDLEEEQLHEATANSLQDACVTMRRLCV